jgi:hypothetical protein
MSKAAGLEETGISLFDCDPTYENLILATRGGLLPNTDGSVTSASRIPKQGAESVAANR